MLKKRSQFLKVAATRRKGVMPGLVLQVRAREKATRGGPFEARLGFTTSRKVGNAVARNRARRRLRAAAREIMPSCARAGFDYVLIGRKATLERPWQALLGDLKAALGKVHRHDNSRHDN